MSGFTEFSIIISVAAIFGVLSRKIKQSELLGYIIAGILLGCFFPGLKSDTERIELFSKIGVSFLLFIVGLELDLSEIKKLGKKVILASLGQILFSFIIAFALSYTFGFNFYASLFIGISLTFSSTIVVIKLLSSQNELDTLQGKLSVVFLVLQDFAAIAIMIFLSMLNNVNANRIFSDVFSILLKGTLVIFIAFVVTKYCVPFFLKFINKERETLFISIIAWALLFSSFVGSHYIGFSIEIGAIIAGISLANRYEHFQIESWMRPLRDFFMTLFFVSLGLKISLDSFDNLILPIIGLSLFVLILKPLIVFFLLRFFKYNKRISFYTGISLAQVSEFSLVVSAVGVASGKIPPSILALITLVGGISMVISSYLVLYKHKLFDILKFIPLFKENNLKNIIDENIDGHIVILGCHRVGKNIIDYLLKQHENIVVVDHNPLRVENLNKLGVKTLMGDLRDVDFFENLSLEKAKFLISTVPSMEINKSILNKIKAMESKPPTLFLAKEEDEVSELYNIGADYVIYPYLLAGYKVNMILKSNSDVNKHKINIMKNILSSRSLGK